VIIPAGFAQVNLLFGGPAYPRGAQITFGVSLGDAPSSAQQVATKCIIRWEADVMPTIASNCTFLGARAKMGPNETGANVVVTALTPGGNAAANDSPQVAVLVKKITAGGGRKNSGRWFLPGITENSTNDGGFVSADRVADLNTRLNDFRTGIAAVGLSMTILHGLAGEAPTPVTLLAVQSLMATQRRRLRKVGGRRKIAAGPV
jgi:hypothetical protein